LEAEVEAQAPAEVKELVQTQAQAKELAKA